MYRTAEFFSEKAPITGRRAFFMQNGSQWRIENVGG